MCPRRRIDIYNTYIPNSYYAESGTSQATPHVAGLAALIWSKYPAYTAAQVWNRITSTAVDLGTAGTDISFGAGRIDVKAALGITLASANEPAAPLQPIEPAAPIDQRAAPIAPGRVIVKFKSVESGITRLAAIEQCRRHQLDRRHRARKCCACRSARNGQWSINCARNPA